jgi:hypothetical protein
MNANEIRDEVISWTRYLPTPDWTTTREQRGIVTGLMNDALRLGATIREADQRRREVIAWLFRDYLGKPNVTALSSKELPDECWWALIQFTDVRHSTEVGHLVAGRDGFNDALVSCWAEMARWDAEMRAVCGESEEENDTETN